MVTVPNQYCVLPATPTLEPTEREECVDMILGTNLQQGSKINDGEFKYHLDRYKYSKRYDNEDPEFHRKKCLKFIESLNNELNNSKYIFDNNISYVDIVLLPFIRQFRIADADWFDNHKRLKKVKNYLHNFLASKILKDVMINYDVWKEESEISYFPITNR